MDDDASDRLLGRIEARSARVAVVGQGYAGLPLSIRAAEVGFPVVGYDVDPDRVAALRDGTSYVGDVSDDALRGALAHGYRPTMWTDDLSAFDVAIICVPTPLCDGAPDPSYIQRAARDLAVHLRPGRCVVLESTTYPGTTTELLVPVLEDESGLKAGVEFFVGYSPERIDPGNDAWRLVNTPKVVSGIDEASLRVVDALYRALVDTTVPVASTAEAELVKLIENTYRHVNIALMNELAIFAHELGVDIWRAIDAAATKPFGFMRFTPGPGVGGHCLPIDPSYLAWRVRQHLGRSFRFVELANDVNAAMPAYVFDRITAVLNEQGKAVKGSRLLLLGLAYKRAASDWRESPSVPLAERLSAAGAVVVFCDPHVAEVNAAALAYPLVPFGVDELERADMVVLLVDHEEFVPSIVAERARLLLDTRGALQGLDYRGEAL